MPMIIPVRRASHGPQFHAIGLRDAGHYIDPFMNVDHAWMSAPTFPPHRHDGFAAISYVFQDSECGIANRDSTGSANLIAPGGVHWLMAGRGAVHEEVPAEAGKTVHALQIFVRVPPQLRTAAPATLSIAPEQVPTVNLPGAEIRIVAGRFGEARADAPAPAAVDILDIALAPGAELAVPIAPGHTTFLLPVQGSVGVAGHDVDPDAGAPVFLSSEAIPAVALRAAQSSARIMVFSGVPYNQ